MKNSCVHILIYCLSVFCTASCSSGEDDIPLTTPVAPPDSAPIPISLDCGIVPNTKITNTGFETNDQIGIYVVNYHEQSPGELSTTGNHVDNMKFTFNTTWTPQTPIYWKDNITPADFYAYYPYGNPSDIAAYPFQVKTNQSSLNEYKACDFLWGKATRIMPTEQAVNIQTTHLFSSIQIKVAAGNGFTSESLQAAQVNVYLNGCKTAALINLKNGVVTPTGTPGTIQPYLENGLYKAMVIPQSVTAEDFIAVRIDNQTYRLNTTFTFEGGKRHSFTVTVNKTSNGINVGINPWEDDTTDHGGNAE